MEIQFLQREETFRLLYRLGMANNIFMPLYGLAPSDGATHRGRLMESTLIEAGQATVGLLIGFLLYVNNLYGPDAAVGHGVVVVPACHGRAGSDLGGAGAGIEYAGDRRGGRQRRMPFCLSARYGSNIRMEKKFCATSVLRWKRGRPTRWWARPAAAKPLRPT